MQVFVVSGASHLAEFNGTSTVADVKEFVARMEGLPCADQVVCYAGVPLSDDSTLAACAVGNLSTLNVTPRLLGGKVHGSLARAGKVKSQTPKKEAQEKAKKLTGRAKRRAQYNKRFVNVVAGFGKKKGPNSNS